MRQGFATRGGVLKFTTGDVSTTGFRSEDSVEVEVWLGGGAVSAAADSDDEY